MLRQPIDSLLTVEANASLINIRHSTYGYTNHIWLRFFITDHRCVRRTSLLLQAPCCPKNSVVPFTKSFIDYRSLPRQRIHQKKKNRKSMMKNRTGENFSYINLIHKNLEIFPRAINFCVNSNYLYMSNYYRTFEDPQNSLGGRGWREDRPCGGASWTLRGATAPPP